MEIFFYITTALSIIIVVLLIWQLARGFSKNASLEGKIDVLKNLQERTEQSVRDEISKFRAEYQSQSLGQRDELSKSLKGFGDSVEQKMESVRLVVDGKLKQIQDDNTRQLEKMRETVDEKLHTTLENRLGEAFRLVSERLEQVQKGLGEMQSLASGVGDLKKVLLNVKTKGVLGEGQLGAILDQILTPAQYDKNVKTKEKSNDHVEFAVKIPSKDDSGSFLWLPIDAKFPTEDYMSLIDAYEKGDIGEIEAYTKSLKAKIEKFAKDISAKYIDPPNTTDFAIMFLPFEGLFAEVLRIPGLFEKIQRDYKITITGPTTISAFLSSLQMGFRTLAIQKRSSEVWKVLGEVKTAFTKFGDTLDAIRDKLDKAVTTVDDARKKSKTLQGKLRAVEEIPLITSDVTIENEAIPELEET